MAAHTQDVSLVRDYAIQNGKKPSVEVVTQIEGLGDLLPEERDQAMAKVMAALAALVAPVNISTIINGDTSAYETGRVNLIRVGIIAVLVLIVATIAAIFLITEFVGSEACTTGCTTMITAVVLVYGACLGLIGAVAYELFHASGIVRSTEYGVFDPYRSAARVLLGVTFGWIFSVTVSFSSLISIFNQTTIGSRDESWRLRHHPACPSSSATAAASSPVSSTISSMASGPCSAWEQPRQPTRYWCGRPLIHPPIRPAERPTAHHAQVTRRPMNCICPQGFAQQQENPVPAIS